MSGPRIRCKWHTTGVPERFQGRLFFSPVCYVCDEMAAINPARREAQTPEQLSGAYGRKVNKPKYNFKADAAATRAKMAPFGMRSDFR